MTTIQQFKSSVLLLTIIAFFCVSAFPVEARTVVRTGDEISVTEDQTIEGDFYTAAGVVNISGEITKDLLLAAVLATMNGSVGGDALILAWSVESHGTIADDLRVIAGEVTIAEPIEGDVFIIGRNVKILSTASIAGDLVIFGDTATIEGAVEGDILGTIDTVRIDTRIGGNVDIATSQLTLGDRADIQGDITYVSSTILIQALNATVSGDTVRNDPAVLSADFSNRSAFVPLFVLLFSVLVWFLVSRHTLNLVVARALVFSPRPALLGFAAIFLLPVASVILMGSMIGVAVGLFVFLVYLLGMLLSMVGMVAVLGQLLMRVFNQASPKLTLITIVIGMTGVCLLLLLPVLGVILLATLSMLTLGALVDSIIRPKVK